MHGQTEEREKCRFGQEFKYRPLKTSRMKENMAAYLFAHFIGEEKDGEQIYFSVSRDGLHWRDLNNGTPVLFSQTGTCGVRDPFLVRNPKTGRIYLIATDLRIEAGRGWEDARENGSKSIIIWETEDLVHWKVWRDRKVSCFPMEKHGV